MNRGTTTDYKKLYWSLQHKIKNDEFYSDNRKMRTIPIALGNIFGGKLDQGTIMKTIDEK